MTLQMADTLRHVAQICRGLDALLYVERSKERGIVQGRVGTAAVSMQCFGGPAISQRVITCERAAEAIAMLDVPIRVSAAGKDYLDIGWARLPCCNAALSRSHDNPTHTTVFSPARALAHALDAAAMHHPHVAILSDGDDTYVAGVELRMVYVERVNAMRMPSDTTLWLARDQARLLSRALAWQPDATVELAWDDHHMCATSDTLRYDAEQLQPDYAPAKARGVRMMLRGDAALVTTLPASALLQGLRAINALHPFGHPLQLSASTEQACVTLEVSDECGPQIKLPVDVSDVEANMECTIDSQLLLRAVELLAGEQRISLYSFAAGVKLAARNNTKSTYIASWRSDNDKH